MANSKENLSRIKRQALNIVKSEGDFLKKPFEELLMNEKLNAYIDSLSKKLCVEVGRIEQLSEEQALEQYNSNEPQRMTYEAIIRSAIADERTRIYVDNVLMERKKDSDANINPSKLKSWLIDGEGASTSALFANFNEVKYLSGEFMDEYGRISSAIRDRFSNRWELSKGFHRDGNLTYKDAGAILAFSPFLSLEDVKVNKASPEVCEKLKSFDALSGVLDKMASSLDFAAVGSDKFSSVFPTIEKPDLSKDYSYSAEFKKFVESLRGLSSIAESSEYDKVLSQGDHEKVKEYLAPFAEKAYIASRGVDEEKAKEDYKNLSTEEKTKYLSMTEFCVDQAREQYALGIMLKRRPFYRDVDGFSSDGYKEMIQNLPRWYNLDGKETKVVGLTEKESAQLIGDLHKLGGMHAELGLNSKGELNYKGLALLAAKMPRYEEMTPEKYNESSLPLVKKAWVEVSDGFFDNIEIAPKDDHISTALANRLNRPSTFEIKMKERIDLLRVRDRKELNELYYRHEPIPDKYLGPGSLKVPVNMGARILPSKGRTLNLDKFTPSGTQATKDNVENISNKKPGRSE